ncbi:hypothetical protein N9N67_05040 [Bacteriovoracaceae bacterium]|nr:hypothetical protein [Bacteriovoracaceae bacterium]
MRKLLFLLLIISATSFAFIIEDNFVGIKPNNTSLSCYFFENGKLFLYLSEEQAVFPVPQDHEEPVIHKYRECKKDDFIVIDDFAGL